MKNLRYFVATYFDGTCFILIIVSSSIVFPSLAIMIFKNEVRLDFSHLKFNDGACGIHGVHTP